MVEDVSKCQRMVFLRWLVYLPFFKIYGLQEILLFVLKRFWHRKHSHVPIPFILYGPFLLLIFYIGIWNVIIFDFILIMSKVLIKYLFYLGKTNYNYFLSLSPFFFFFG